MMSAAGLEARLCHFCAYT